jgi:ubiquinone biosynthesis protein COQ9
MVDNRKTLKEKFLKRLLAEVPFDGWSWSLSIRVSDSLGIDERQLHDLFPEGLQDILLYFSNWADEQMLIELKSIDNKEMRVRDRISYAVTTRLKILEPHKEAVKLALAYWSSPKRTFMAARTLWQTSDKIWKWAGDSSKDYNFYTKRSLLSGVISTTTLAWLDNEDFQETEDFLSRRIQNVMDLGSFIGKIKKAS